VSGPTIIQLRRAICYYLPKSIDSEQHVARRDGRPS